VTTEGGLDVVTHRDIVEVAIRRLQESGVFVSLFLDPEPRQIELAVQLNADAVELHTGQYALAKAALREDQLIRLTRAGALVHELGMSLHAGHGLNYNNVGPVAGMASMRELNIGHSIVSRAVYVGMTQAVREMKEIIERAQRVQMV
jgi:pyridoxine 5-phosphate synthase